jgi:hypothetical protein
MTTRGELRAAHVVVATHYPIFDRGLFFVRCARTCMSTRTLLF